MNGEGRAGNESGDPMRASPEPASSLVAPGGGARAGEGVGEAEADEVAARDASSGLAMARRILGTLVFLGGAAFVYANVENQDLRDALPLFTVAIFLQLAPFWVPAKPDPFSPPALSGFFNSIALFAGLAYYVDRQEIWFELVPQLSPAGRAELLQKVLAANVLGTLSYYAAYIAVGPRAGKKLGERFRARVWDSRRVWIACGVGLAIFVPAYAFFQGRVGTSLTDVQSLAAGKAVWRDDQSLSWMQRAIVGGLLPPAIYLAFSLPRPKLAPLLLVVASTAALVLAVTRLGQRGFGPYFVLNLLIIAHYMWRRIPASLLMGLALFAIAATNQLGEWRRGDMGRLYEVETRTTGIVGTLAAHEQDRQRLAAMATVLHAFPQRKDYLMGESWIGLTVAFVPRWLWPAKREFITWADTGIVYQLTGAPIPSNFISTLYANFSWAGIAVGTALWGAFHRLLYNWLLRDTGERAVVLIYSMTVIYFGPTLLQVALAMQFVLPAIAAVLYVAKRREQDEERTLLGVAARAS